MTGSSPKQDSLSALNAADDALRATIAAVTKTPVANDWSPTLVQFLALAVLIFTFLSLLLCAVLLWRQRASGTQILRIFGVLTIVGMSALLVVIGYSNEQLTPIVGLFGAIAGYLLGKETYGEHVVGRPTGEK